MKLGTIRPAAGATLNAEPTLIYNSTKYQGFVQGTDGNLYSTAQYGGTYNRGVVFKMTLPR